uniref:ABC transporter domain-containing protein n=1 Tax=Amorphochlora amoebiformis TaxID=1561963 RepID=A0A7S0DCB3_9EUKA
MNGFYRPKRISGTIEFKNVSFQYPTRQDVEVLRGLSFSVKKGQVVALVGPSGSGKSSVFRILQRFYPIQKGSIYLDGRKLDEYHPSVLRHRIGIVSQEPVLFNRTIRENLIYGCTDETPSDEEIISALKKANAWGFVSKLPDRLRTEVGHRGTKLSGGQKQRIAIARALLTKPSMLLLDEATSALDTEAEKKVQQALDKMIKEVGGTTLVIAHRLSTIRNADKIIVLKDGRNMEEGSHGQLVKKKGIYASLVQHQQTEEKGLTAPGTPGPRPPSDEERDRDNPIELMSSTRARPGSENDVPGLIRHYSSPY